MPENSLQLVKHVDDFGQGQASWHTLKPVDSDAATKAAPIVFVAANGIPTACYLPVARGFAAQGREIYFYHNRSFWPDQPLPDKAFRWRKHAEDLQTFLTQIVGQPATVIGHSFGGNLSAMNAVHHPQLIRELLLIDPAGLPSHFMGQLFHRIPDKLKEKLPMMPNVASRRNAWPSQRAFVNYLKTRPVYRDFTEEAVQLYAEHGLIARRDGYALSCSPLWEAHIFRHVFNLWRLLPRISCPTLFLRAEQTYLYADGYAKRQCARNKAYIDYTNMIGASHLVPLEHPERIYRELSQWLSLQAGN